MPPPPAQGIFKLHMLAGISVSIATALWAQRPQRRPVLLPRSREARPAPERLEVRYREFLAG